MAVLVALKFLQKSTSGEARCGRGVACVLCSGTCYQWASGLWCLGVMSTKPSRRTEQVDAPWCAQESSLPDTRGRKRGTEPVASGRAGGDVQGLLGWVSALRSVPVGPCADPRARSRLSIPGRRAWMEPWTHAGQLTRPWGKLPFNRLAQKLVRVSRGRGGWRGRGAGSLFTLFLSQLLLVKAWVGTLHCEISRKAVLNVWSCDSWF